MNCEYPFCKNKAKHPDTILGGFTCTKHFSMLDFHTDPDGYKKAMRRVDMLERLEILGFKEAR